MAGLVARVYWTCMVLIFGLFTGYLSLSMLAGGFVVPHGLGGLAATAAMTLMSGLLLFEGFRSARALFALLRNGRPPSVTLSENGIRYDPGTMFDGLCFYSGPELTVSREDGRQIEVVELSGRQYLFVRTGAAWNELGECLREPEREWLASLLTTWPQVSIQPRSQTKGGNGEIGRLWPESPGTRPGCAGITVECDRDAKQIRVVWFPLAASRLARCALVASLVACLFGWAFFALPILVWVTGLVQPPRSPMQLLILPAVLPFAWGWAFYGHSLMRGFWRFVRQMDCEQVTLSEAALAFKPGCYFGDLHPMTCDKPCVVPHEHVTCVQLRIDGRGKGRLIVDDGASRIEIGRTLRDPEREWMAAVLQAWLEAPGQLWREMAK